MEKVKLFFEDLTYNTEYDFLEVGKNDDELEKIAKKRGIKLPSHDLAIFKGRYAFVNEFNKNNCRLPKKEVEKALDTLALKAVDIDHVRKNVCGMWLDAQLEGKEIIAYGAFFKSNFDEEYTSFKKKMKNGKVKISFEAWGDREPYEDGKYDLTNIEFAGGALLEKTEPAFKQAEVLEFAKVIEAQMVKCKNCGHEFDFNKVLEYKGDTRKCPKCLAIINQNGEVLLTPQIIDFHVSCPSCKVSNWNILEKEQDTAKLKCLGCAKEYNVNFEAPKKPLLEGLYDVVDTKQTPCPQCGNIISFGMFISEKLMELKCKKCGLVFPKTYELAKKRVKSIKEIKDNEKKSHEGGSSMAEEKKVEQKEEAKEIEIIEKEADKKIEKVEEIKEVVEKPIEKTEDEVIEKTTVEEAKIDDKEVYGYVEPIIEKTPEKPELSTEKLKEGIKKMASELMRYKDTVEKYEEELAFVKEFNTTEMASLKAEIEKKVTDAVTVEKRKTELREYAEKLSDEELLDDDKYTIAKLEKEKAELLEGKKETPISSNMEIGVKGKSKDIKTIFEKQKRIDKIAFGK